MFPLWELKIYIRKKVCHSLFSVLRKSQADSLGSRQDLTLTSATARCQAGCAVAGKSSAGQSAEQAAAAAASAEGQEASLVRAPVKHVLSQELQLYFDRVALLLRAQPGLCTSPVAPLIPAIAFPQLPPSLPPFLPPSLPPSLPLLQPASLPHFSSAALLPSLPCWHVCS